MQKESHRLEIGSRVIEYVIRPSHRAKRIILKITRLGAVEVVVPANSSLAAGKEFVLSRAEWIVKHLSKINPAKQRFYYKGRELKLIHTKDEKRRSHLIRIQDDLLLIDSPPGGKLTPYELYMEFLKRNGKDFLINRCAELAGKYDFHPKRITIRGQKTRWGSCSRRGTLSINYKLMQVPPEAIDYVLIHELCHLRHMNHSKKFWAEVGKYVPDYKRLDKLINKFRT